MNLPMDLPKITLLDNPYSRYGLSSNMEKGPYFSNSTWYTSISRSTLTLPATIMVTSVDHGMETDDSDDHEIHGKKTPLQTDGALHVNRTWSHDVRRLRLLLWTQCRVDVPPAVHGSPRIKEVQRARPPGNSAEEQGWGTQTQHMCCLNIFLFWDWNPGWKDKPIECQKGRA